MGFHRRGNMLRPINATKNISEQSQILAAVTNTVAHTMVVAAENALLSAANQVERGSTVNSVFISNFFISEGGEVANEVPLVDWYILKDTGGRMVAAGFVADGLPTPGATGIHENKRYILHTEKGLSGGGDASLSGVPMIFKGVIRIPKGMRQFKANDLLVLVTRTNFATKVCSQAIYKWYK